MAVARVQYIAESGLQILPPQFVRPQHERPLTDIDGPTVNVPLIDFSLLHVHGQGQLRDQTMAEIAKASKEWGIFQVVNHGISQQLIQRLKAVGKELFELPQEEKESYANNAAEGVLEGYGTKLAYNSDGKLEWIDYYFHTLYPPSRANKNNWPKHPSSYIEVTDEYGRGLLGVMNTLLLALSIDLGLEERALKEALGGEDIEMEMKINYYPTCPQPELALGVEAHTDMSALTLLVPNEVPGLQVYKDGFWVGVDYVPNAIIVHIGDQLEILSNGKFKSVLHRSLVSKEKVRMSWAVFCCPPAEKMIGPMEEVLSDENRALFNAKTYGEFKYRKINKLDQ